MKTPTNKAESMGDDQEVWRVCRVIKGDCHRCPETEMIGGDECVRACRLQADECINVVETGNPWRKTDNVRAPWIVKDTPNG